MEKQIIYINFINMMPFNFHDKKNLTSSNNFNCVFKSFLCSLINATTLGIETCKVLDGNTLARDINSRRT